MSDESFPSGPWLGFFTYSGRPDRHRMNLGLTFANGTIRGEGTDDIGAFIIHGRYDANAKESHWNKAYIGRHDVYYRGFREGKGIWGTWELDSLRGGFKIWPIGSGTDEDDVKAEALGQEQPVDAVGVVIQ
jgi:hypothetical protein